MKTTDATFDLPELAKFSKEFRARDFLFRQGEPASSLIIVTRGLVDLIVEQKGEHRLVSVVEAGQFLGEKALVRKAPFKRTFSAKAQTDIKVLELSSASIEEIERNHPAVLITMMKRMFYTATLRLDRSNFLIHCLRDSDNVKRLIHLIVFFARAYGQRKTNGIELPLLVDGVRYYIDMEVPQIETALNELCLKRLLVPTSPGQYLLPDEAALLEFAAKLSERMSSGYFDEMEAIP